ncbi:MAG: sulfotransferase, partial [Phycisphaerales bacterium]|nr:sulfotransferase [Phycisphaerales bacterium]
VITSQPQHDRPSRSGTHTSKSAAPYLVVVGCPRSGTTLLQRMLDAHPELAVTNDTHFIPKVLPNAVGEPNPLLTEQLVRAVRTYKRFYRMKLSDDAVDAAAQRSSDYREFVSALYQEVGRARGKRLTGEKTPDYVRHLKLLRQLFPWIKIIHIIRDGRDVALSALEWAGPTKGPGKLALWAQEPVAVCALWWQWNVRFGLRDAAALGPQSYRRVRYEDLVARPEPVLGDLCDFLQLSFDAHMLNFHEGKTKHKAGLSPKSAWLPATPGLRNWRTQMSCRDQELFEALAGDLLLELGYELAVGKPSVEIAEVAARCRAWWLQEKELDQPVTS